ncbi:MAG: hypothetical protein ACFFDI_24985 [Promethearchaeota archaeon]
MLTISSRYGSSPTIFTTLRALIYLASQNYLPSGTYRIMVEHLEGEKTLVIRFIIVFAPSIEEAEYLRSSLYGQYGSP